MNPLHFGSHAADAGMRINQDIRIRIQDHCWLRQPKAQKSNAQSNSKMAAFPMHGGARVAI